MRSTGNSELPQSVTTNGVHCSNLVDRDHEDALQTCEEYGIGFIPYFPIAAGSISRIEAIQEVADAHDATVYQVALPWLLEHSAVTLPIPGAGSLEHLEENIAASSISLSNEEYSRVPTLVCVGEDETLLETGGVEYVAEHTPDAELVWFENSSHCPFLEEPNRFNTVLSGFVDSQQ